MEEYIKRSDVLNEIESLKKSPWYNDKSDNVLACFERQNAVEFVENLCIKNIPAADEIKIIGNNNKLIILYPT